MAVRGALIGEAGRVDRNRRGGIMADGIIGYFGSRAESGRCIMPRQSLMCRVGNGAIGFRADPLQVFKRDPSAAGIAARLRWMNGGSAARGQARQGAERI